MANPKTKNILISMMIAMSSAFLIGSILLLSRDAYANESGGGNSYQYTGYADTREVVSEAVFVKSGNLTAEVGKMKVENEGVMRITSGAVVSSGNTFSSRAENSNIIGGANNNAGRVGNRLIKNTTLLGGFKNKVSMGDNHVMLGGSGNNINKSQSMMIGGKENQAMLSGTGAVIGGEKNVFTNNNVFILGGTSNTGNIENLIVAGSGGNYNNNSLRNIFAFSNAPFKPETSNTFYINATKGLGINGPSTKSGVNVHGIVKVGSVTCDNNNLGAIGMASNGCLVGCKKSSNNSPKWHLIDKSKTCQDWCQENSSSCETTSPADTTRELREGVCTGEVATNSNYKECGSVNRAKSLTGVSFISYFTPACPQPNENGMVNPCAYTCIDPNDDRCKTGSHNGGDNAPSCTGVEPNGNGVIKSNKIPTQNKDWSGVNNKTQDQLNACEWTCSGGYEVYGNGCRKKQSQCGTFVKNTCLNSVTPTGQSYKDNEYTWFCGEEECGMCDDEDGTIPPTLHNGYCANQTCKSPENRIKNETKTVVGPEYATQGGDTTKVLYENKAKAEEHSCGYYCNNDNGYFFFPATGDVWGNRCAECAEGYTGRDENGNLICLKEKVRNCEDGFTYENGQCVATGPQGHCYYKNNKNKYFYDDNNVFFRDYKGLGFRVEREYGTYWQYEDRGIDNFRPMGANEIIPWTCTNDETAVQENSCQFTCDWNYGEVCSKRDGVGRWSCDKASCFSDSTHYIQSAINDGMISENPSKENVDEYGHEHRKYFEASSQADFEARVPSEGCYYRCPADRLYYNQDSFYEDSSKRRCYATQAERDKAIEDDNKPFSGSSMPSYSCSNKNQKLYGYSNYQDVAYGQDREWQTYAEIGGYERYNRRGCMEGCTSQATDVKNSEYVDGKVCRKKCNINEYFDYSHMNGGCKACEPWQIGDPTNKKDGNSIDCVNVCGEGQAFCPNCGEGKECIITSYVPGGECVGGEIIIVDGVEKCVTEMIVHAKEFFDWMDFDRGNNGRGD